MSGLPDVLNEEQAAALLECEPATVQEEARKGELPGLKIGRRWIFPKTALLEVLHRRALDNKPKKVRPKAVAAKPRTLRTVPPRLPTLPQSCR